MSPATLTTPNNRVAGARRIADRERRKEFQQALAGLDPEFVAKVRHDSLVAAHNRLRGTGATPEEVVRDAQQHFRSRILFLTGGRS